MTERTIVGTAVGHDPGGPVQPPRDLLRRWAVNETVQAAVILALLLNIFFFPFLWGNETILASARSAPAITQIGAAGDAPPLKLGHMADAGGPAWFLEPLVQVIRREYLQERTVPLWNPYAGYGVPLAAAMQPQVFHPLTVLLSLHPTPTAFAFFFVIRLWIAGFFTYLFLKLFIRHTPSLAGAVAFMFTGYFIIFLNMFHLSVEVMLPAVFFAFESLHRRFDTRTIVLSSVVVLTLILGGAPESIFLVLTFACLYYLSRSITDSASSGSIAKQVGRLILVNVLGFGMAGLLLVPFTEYARGSFTTHAGDAVRGVEAPMAGREAFGYLVPLVEGPPNSRGIIFGTPSLVYGYFGITATLLALVAVVGWIGDRRRRDFSSVPLLIPFFALAATLMIMKQYGNPLVQWVGLLPVVRMVVLYKYLEPLIGFSVAVLCGMGVERVLVRRCRPFHVAVATSLLLAAFLIGYAAFLPDAIVAKQNASIFFESTTAALLVFLVVSVILALDSGAEGASASTGRVNRIWRHTDVLLVGCLVGELLLVYFYPLFYKYDQQPPKSTNAFLGAPYVSWLQQTDTQGERVFGREGFLHPNWSGVFGIPDVRDVDAMYPEKYLPFVREFFPVAAKGDLRDRFTGTVSDYSFGTAMARRFLQLSSVRYLITGTRLEVGSLTSEFLAVSKANAVPGEIPLDETDWTIGGVTKHVLFQHPPSAPKGVRVKVEPGSAELRFSLGMEPKGYGGRCGDGVDFMVDVNGPDGSVKRVFRGFINPYGNPADRHWFDEKVDLSAYNGQTVNLLLSTGPGPKGDNCMDWAGWGDVSLGKPAFSLAYNKEVKIYEYPSILPRAAIFYGVDVMPTDGEVLKRLVDPGFDVFQRAVVTSSELSSEAVQQLGELKGNPPRVATAAKIVRMASREVDIDASLDQHGLLVLNDTDYPGWRAYVDGKEREILNANYLFRGVLLDRGHHRVNFRYEPSSFPIGLAISLLSTIGLVLASRFAGRLGLA
jgi:hypothetical protein